MGNYCGRSLKDADGLNARYYKIYPFVYENMSIDDIKVPSAETPKSLPIDFDPVIAKDYLEEWYDGVKKPNKFLQLYQTGVHERFPLIPHADDPRWGNLEEAREYCRGKFDGMMPISLDYEDWTSDQAVIDLCSVHHGLFFLEKDEDDDTYFVDLLFLKEFKVRDGYHRWGAKIVFNEAMDKIISITVGKKTLKPPKKKASAEAQELWKVFKLRVSSTIMCATTAKLHLIELHWNVAGPLSIHTRNDLSYANPLRVLLEPFQFNTPQINFSATHGLFHPEALLERCFPMADGEFQRLAEMCNSIFVAKTPRQEIEERGLEGLHTPLSMEGVEFWDIVETFVEGMLQPYLGGDSDSSDDEDSDEGITAASFGEFADEVEAWENGMRKNLNVKEDDLSFVELITYCIYAVTGRHEAVGTIGFDYAWFAPNGTCKGNTMLEAYPGKNVTYTTLLLASFTAFKMPQLMSDLTKVFPDEDVHGTVEEFLDSLGDLHERVKEYNKDRKRSSPMFDPAVMEISVSV